MSDFDPVTLYFILSEGLAAWLWLLIALALVLLAGIVLGFSRLRRARRPVRRPLTAALVVGLVTAVAFTFLVPAWTLTGPDMLSAPVDYAFAFLLALVPAGIIGAAVFLLAAMRCASMTR